MGVTLDLVRVSGEELEQILSGDSEELSALAPVSELGHLCPASISNGECDNG